MDPSVSLKFANEDFYSNGEFDKEKAKDAYIAVMQYHGYPVPESFKEKLWVSDYGIGDFANLGLGAVMFMNDEKERYMLMDLYLLPNQMLPEHFHLPTDKGKEKMEGWLVRHGVSHIVGEGEETPGLRAMIPKSQQGVECVTVFHDTVCKPGMYAQLNRPTARHWQLAGSEGAIITESATFHDDTGVRHTNPKLVFP